jgi:hypothetical protein
MTENALLLTKDDKRQTITSLKMYSNGWHTSNKETNWQNNNFLSNATKTILYMQQLQD